MLNFGICKLAVFYRMIKSNNRLETSRTYLRNFCLDDLDLLYQLHSDPQVMQHFHTGPRSRLEIIKNLHDYIQHQEIYNFSNWAVFEKNTDQFIGRAGPLVWEAQQSVELSYVLHQKFWGLGFATELAGQIITWIFKNLTVDKIVAVTTPENLASQKVMSKVGMQLDQHTTLNGLPAVQYIIYRPDTITQIIYPDLLY